MTNNKGAEPLTPKSILLKLSQKPVTAEELAAQMVNIIPYSFKKEEIKREVSNWVAQMGMLDALGFQITRKENP